MGGLAIFSSSCRSMRNEPCVPLRTATANIPISDGFSRESSLRRSQMGLISRFVPATGVFPEFHCKIVRAATRTRAGTFVLPAIALMFAATSLWTLGSSLICRTDRTTPAIWTMGSRKLGTTTLAASERFSDSAMRAAMTFALPFVLFGWCSKEASVSFCSGCASCSRRSDAR